MHFLHFFLVLLVTAFAFEVYDDIYLRDAAIRDHVPRLRQRGLFERSAELSAREWNLKVPFYSRTLRDVLDMWNRDHIVPMGKSLLQLDLTGAGDEVPLDDKQTSQLAATKKLWQDLELDGAITGLPKFAKRTTGLDSSVSEMVQTLKNYKARLERIEATVVRKSAKHPPTAHTN